jgi:predicted nucleotidyltransferase
VKDLLTENYQPVVQALMDKFGDRLRAVVLFGSQARRDAQPESDHDLFVIIDGLPEEPVSRQSEVRSVLLPILSQTPGQVSFVAKTPQEFEANLTPLMLDVSVDGICLFGEHHFEPYRRRALAAIEQAGLQRRRLDDT